MVIINKDTLDMETIRGNTASFAFKWKNIAIQIKSCYNKTAQLFAR